MRNFTLSRSRRSERGVTIILVAVAMVFMIMALAAIAVDVVSLYTARSQASHAADAAAMAGAKTLANSGLTSDPTNTNLQTAAQALATQIAASMATQNKISGQTITSANVSVSFPNAGQPSFVVNPQVSVSVARTDLPTYFARAAGRAIVPVGSTSVAEAFNPSLSSTLTGAHVPIPIAPKCVKPWILPNMDPTHPGQAFFNAATGAIISPGMVGVSLPPLTPVCGGRCTTPPPAPAAGKYYYGDVGPGATALPACSSSTCAYEQNISACSQQPIVCGVAASLPNASIDTGACGFGYRNKTYNATQCLIHGSAIPDIDQITVVANQPPQFLAGDNNPLVLSGAIAADSQVTSSDSLVTIPVSDQTTGWTPSTNINVIGFIQGFITQINNAGGVTVTIVNMSGCGTGATATPVLGDGISPVPVHLISQ